MSSEDMMRSDVLEFPALEERKTTDAGFFEALDTTPHPQIPEEPRTNELAEIARIADWLDRARNEKIDPQGGQAA